MYTETVYPVINLAETGRRIERQRRQAGLTVRDLQTSFGFEYPQAIYKWQHGECLPTVDNLLALARLLRVPMEDLLVYEDREVRHFGVLRARKTARWAARARKIVQWTIFTEQRAGRPWKPLHDKSAAATCAVRGCERPEMEPVAPFQRTAGRQAPGRNFCGAGINPG